VSSATICKWRRADQRDREDSIVGGGERTAGEEESTEREMDSERMEEKGDDGVTLIGGVGDDATDECRRRDEEEDACDTPAAALSTLSLCHSLTASSTTLCCSPDSPISPRLSS